MKRLTNSPLINKQINTDVSFDKTTDSIIDPVTNSLLKTQSTSVVTMQTTNDEDFGSETSEHYYPDCPDARGNGTDGNGSGFWNSVGDVLASIANAISGFFSSMVGGDGSSPVSSDPADYSNLLQDIPPDLLNDNSPDALNEIYADLWNDHWVEYYTNNPSVPNPQILKDTSITNHPTVNCVVNHLLDDITSNGLKSILGAFISSLGSNVIIKAVSGLDGDGKTLQPNSQNNPTNNYVIEINADKFNDTTNPYSRIYLTETIIHEAFHAMLLQKEIAAYNTTDISKWQVPPLPTDSTLLELYNDYVYYKDSLKVTVPSMEQIQYDWEANHINLIAAALEDFVETNYKTTAASVGNDIKAYESFIYLSDKDIGYDNTRFNASNATALGGSTAIQIYIGNFGVGNPVNCSN